MPANIFAYIFKYSARQQMIVFAGSLVYLPLLYLSFELPKIIVNDALGADAATFPRHILGADLDQVGYLFSLCGALLALVLVTGGIRYAMSVYKGVLGEIMLRRLRYDLFTRILRFPISHLKKVQPGEIVTMTTAEAEPLGRFMGVAVANPTLQGGTMLTALVFLFAQDWLLGLAAISLFPVQAYLVPKLQTQMNSWSRKRLANVRLFAGQISETIDGYNDIHAHDTTAYEMAKVSRSLGTLFRIRRALYKIGNTIIFLNNFFTQLTPFLFYAIGGYLVLKGDLTLGALVAVIAAYRETATPWNDLLEYYQSLEDNRVKYAALVDNFSPKGLREIPESDRAPGSGETITFAGDLSISNLTLKDGEDSILESVSLTAPLDEKIAILGPAGSGKVELAEIIAGLRPPESGGLELAGHDLTALSEITIGKTIAYIDQSSHIFTGTWRDNLYYGLKHHPVSGGDPASPEQAAWRKEAEDSGNTVNSADADWIDFQAIGYASRQELEKEAARTIHVTGLADGVFEAGMRHNIDAENPPALLNRVLQARHRFETLLAQSDVADAVEHFNVNTFNTNASLMENLLFGKLLGDGPAHELLANDDEFTRLLSDAGLLETLVQIGHAAVSQIVNLFHDLPVGDERLSRFSIIDPEDIPRFRALLARVPDLSGDGVGDTDRAMLLSVAFLLVPAQHRLGLINNRLQVKIVNARTAILAALPNILKNRLAVADPEKVMLGTSLRANILFGYPAQHQRHRHDDIDALVGQVIDELGLREEIMELGLDQSIGVAGSRLAPPQKQKLALARCLLKRPKLLVINEALASLEPAEQENLLQAIVEERPEGGLIWIDREREDLAPFGRAYLMRNGRIVNERTNGDDKLLNLHPETPAKTSRTLSIREDVQILDQVPMLRNASQKTLKLIAFTADEIHFKDGESLFSRGDRADHAYIVTRGQANATLGDEPGLPAVEHYESGSLIGAPAIISNIPRPISVRATGPLTVLRLERELFLELLDKDTNLSATVMRDLSNRLAHSAAGSV